MKKSPQPRGLVVKGPKQSCWLIDSTTNIHVHNNQRLMIEYLGKPTRVKGSSTDGISPNRRKVNIQLPMKDG